MPLDVKDQLYLDVKVNGQSIPISEGSFQKLEMIENVQNKLPTFEFVYNDGMNFLHDIKCVEGSPVDITFHSNKSIDPGPRQTVSYTVTGTHSKLRGNTIVWTVNGVYKAVKYLGGLVKGSYPGNSHDVVQQLGGECSLIVKADSFSDKMNWQPSRETYSDFIANIVEHGYGGDSSITSHAVNDQGELHYKDLQKLAGAPATKVIISGTPDMVVNGIIPCINYEMWGMAGIYNFMYNYGLKVVQEQLSGDASILNQYMATMFSEFSNISSTIKDALGGDVRSEYFPPDHGNTHEKYPQAEYQNRRGRQLFNNRAEFNLATCSGINLYDVVSFNPVIPSTGKVSDLWNGNYTVSAKTKYIQGLYYMEKIQSLTSGFNSNPGFLASPPKQTSTTTGTGTTQSGSSAPTGNQTFDI